MTATCWTCCHWAGHRPDRTIEGYAACDASGYGKGLAAASGLGDFMFGGIKGLGVYTQGYFGCNQWATADANQPSPKSDAIREGASQ